MLEKFFVCSLKEVCSVRRSADLPIAATCNAQTRLETSEAFQSTQILHGRSDQIWRYATLEPQLCKRGILLSRPENFSILSQETSSNHSFRQRASQMGRSAAKRLATRLVRTALPSQRPFSTSITFQQPAGQGVRQTDIQARHHRILSLRTRDSLFYNVIGPCRTRPYLCTLFLRYNTVLHCIKMFTSPGRPQRLHFQGSVIPQDVLLIGRETRVGSSSSGILDYLWVKVFPPPCCGSVECTH